MKRRGFIQGLLGALPAAAAGLKSAPVLVTAVPQVPAALGPPAGISVLGRSAASSGVMTTIAAGADGQVLRRVGGQFAWSGGLDLADTDAVTGLLPLANLRDDEST